MLAACTTLPRVYFAASTWRPGLETSITARCGAGDPIARGAELVLRPASVGAPKQSGAGDWYSPAPPFPAAGHEPGGATGRESLRQEFKHMATKKDGAAATKGAAKKSGAATTVAAKPGDSLAPATETAASGAVIEPDLALASLPDHPSVDRNPREGVPAESNQIDFNTPSALKPEAEQVAENLDAVD